MVRKSKFNLKFLIILVFFFNLVSSTSFDYILDPQYNSESSLDNQLLKKLNKFNYDYELQNNERSKFSDYLLENYLEKEKSKLNYLKNLPFLSNSQYDYSPINQYENYEDENNVGEVGKIKNKNEKSSKISEKVEEDERLRKANKEAESMKHATLLSQNDLKSLKGNIEVKKEETLPFYCHPPNPCPKGYTEKNGCQESMENTANYQKEWVKQMEKKGFCSCDQDHMFDCSGGKEEEEEEEKEEGRRMGSLVIGKELDKVWKNIIHDNKNPFTNGGKKRVSMVAKKSPRYKRDLKNIENQMKIIAKRGSKNPYLKGSRLHRVAKKGK